MCSCKKKSDDGICIPLFKKDTRLYCRVLLSVLSSFYRIKKYLRSQSEEIDCPLICFKSVFTILTVTHTTTDRAFLELPRRPGAWLIVQG